MALGRGLLLAAGLTLSFAGSALAQDCLGRPDFDACMARPTIAAQQRNAAGQQRLVDEYMRIYGPWLRQQYSQYRGPYSFEQFVYWNMMTANGTNIQGGADAQRRQIEGMQTANRTRREGGEDYIDGQNANSRRAAKAAENYAEGAIRGTVGEVDPQSGQVIRLPYAQPYNHPFSTGGQTYVQNQTGYYQWNGSDWVQMRPAQ